jgi:inosine/xanthosine triphosphate pyrophosphatase family protein
MEKNTHKRKKLLLGTRNPAKIAFFLDVFKKTNVELLSLNDVSFDHEPIESGKDPQENACIKAEFYAQSGLPTLAEDQGLYFMNLDLADARQPGVYVRRVNQKEELDDEQMLAHYCSLIHSMSGQVKACYINAYALHISDKTYSYMQSLQEKEPEAFEMVDTPCPQRHPGYPLDSISLYPDGSYFAQDLYVSKAEKKNEERLREFVEEILFRQDIKEES